MLKLKKNCIKKITFNAYSNFVILLNFYQCFLITGGDGGDGGGEGDSGGDSGSDDSGGDAGSDEDKGTTE